MKQWTKFWHNPQLDVGLLQAHFTHHAYPRHSHDYYVICVVEQGLQSFTYGGTKYFTPPGGIILLNPDAVHTGEPAHKQGFKMRSLYPTTAHMQQAVFELTGRHQEIPFFSKARVDNWSLANDILVLHQALTDGASDLECEARFSWVLTQLIKQYADLDIEEQGLGQERKAIRQARHYIDENFAQGISLTQLAEIVALSPYHLLRVFRTEVGMPPHAYQESVRIRQAQQLLEAGKPLVEVAVDVGFSSQSHLTHRFKQIIGTTPGYYAQQLKNQI